MLSNDSRLILGIDTGGTYTDAAICREDSHGLTLVTSAKSRTTKDNLTIGIRNAVQRLDPELLKQVYRVSLSTTLATNACVENMGSNVAVVIIDSEPPLEEKTYTDCGLPAPKDILFLPGVINVNGEILERPAREDILTALSPVCAPGVSVAISGVFSTRNAELENEVAEIARELGAKTVCGRDVAPGQLNYIKRAATAMLNGRLQPIIRNFLNAVGQALQELNLDVPIDIVRSDGSLMSRDFALEYPVETLLCGPAASVSGVISLLNSSESDHAAISEQDYIIADMGGTTTDLSLVLKGQAVRTKDGVNIGSYRTCVQSIFVETLGLGGDTRLFADRSGILCLDTNRAIPLCVLASDYPEIKAELHSLAEDNRFIWNHIHSYEYRVLVRQPLPEELQYLSEEEKDICKLTAKRPFSVYACAAEINRDPYLLRTDRLEQLGILRKSAITLTDLLHIEGGFTAYDSEASKLGARLFCTFFKIDEEEFCRRGRELATFRLYRAIIKMCLQKDHPNFSSTDEAGIEKMIETAFAGGGLVETSFRLPCALVGIGAAAQAFVPDVGKHLSAPVILPQGAAVANAIGAAASSFRTESHREILYNSITDFPYQVFGGNSPHSFETYEEALEEAKQQAEQEVIRLARARGILGKLNIQVNDQRNLLQNETQFGTITIDLGGIVTAIAEAETISDVNNIAK